MSDIYVDVRGNMSPTSPMNGRSYTIKELQERLKTQTVSVLDLRNYWLACDPHGYRGQTRNKIAIAWCEAVGDYCDVYGSAILIEKEHYVEPTD